jgi:hypothetical protein
MKSRLALGVALGSLSTVAPLLVYPWLAQGVSRDRAPSAPEPLYGLVLSAARAISPRVTGSWSVGSAPNTYRYTYTLVNEPSSKNAIRYFALAPVRKPLSVTAPLHWDAAYGYEDRDDALVFSVIDGGTTPPAEWDSVNIFPSPFDLQPGDSVVFSFVSDRAPAIVRYYVQDFHTLPLDNESGTLEDPPTLFQSSVIGTVVGPKSVSGKRRSP